MFNNNMELKMKKLTFVISFVLIFCSVQLYGNNYPGSKRVVVYMQPNSGPSLYSFGSGLGIDIGYKYSAQAGFSEKARSEFSFNLSNIPSNASITNVHLDLSVTPGNSLAQYNLDITEITHTDIPLDSWTNIGAATALFSDMSYSGGALSSNGLTDLVNNHKGGTLYLGVFSKDESHSDSWATVSLTLSMDVSTPPAQLSLHIRNDLNGGEGGNIGVGIYPNAASSRPSPCDFNNAYEGNRLNLAAYDNQNVNGKTWFFNDTELPNYKSDWKKYNNNVYTNLSNNASFTTSTLSSGDNNATHIAYLKTTSYTTSGTMSASEDWIANNTLTGNVTIPSGVTLKIEPGVTVNLNGHSIITNGGTIVDNSPTINGLRATLRANPTLRGLCGTIQAAANYAGSTNEIYFANGNFNENVTISNKYNLSILGNENYQPFGSLTITGCTAFEAMGFQAKNISISNCSYLILIDVYAYGTDQSTIGFSLYNSDTYDLSYLTSFYSRIGISCWDGTEADIDISFLFDNLTGVESFNGSNVYINNSRFCGTALDLRTYNFASIRAYNCFFDGGKASTSGSSIIHMGDQSCSLSKASSNQLTENNIDNNEGSEFEKINSAYFSLNKKLANALKGKTDFDKGAFCIDYGQVINDYQKIINKNPESPLAKVALIASAKSYRRIDDLRGKNDFADMKNFLSVIIGKSEYAALKPQAERLMMEYYRLTKDFKKAIETADNLTKNYKENADYLSGVLYAKGLIEAYDLNQPDIATKTFSNILQQYPENSLAVLAENELRVLGKEVNKKITAEDDIAINEIELNNYPNPFNPVTTINYSLPIDEKVVIKVYDILGREIKELVNDFKIAGKYSVQFDGSKLSSGVYFYRMEAGKYSQTKKLILAK